MLVSLAGNRATNDIYLLCLRRHTWS